MLKNQLAFATLLGALLLGGGTLITSCSPADKQDASGENQQAHRDFQVFVVATEAKVDAVGDELEADYDRETAELKAAYDAKAAAVDKYAEQYDDARRREMQTLRARYQAAYAGPDTAGSSQNADADSVKQQEEAAESTSERSKVRRAADNAAYNVKKLGKGVGQEGAKVAKSVGNAVKGVFEKNDKK